MKQGIGNDRVVHVRTMVHVNKGTTGATGIKDTRILAKGDLQGGRRSPIRCTRVPSWWRLEEEVAMKEKVFIVWGWGVVSNGGGSIVESKTKESVNYV